MAFSLYKIIKGLLISEENSLSPKEIEITPGGTAGTKTTVLSSQTTNKTVTLPDATDTLVGKATADVLTNKTIDADGTGNNISNIDDGNIKAAAGIDASKIADGTVSSTEFQYINTLSSNAQTQMTANATAISDHLADTVDAHDASAISFVPTGTIAGTDVQTAVVEVASEAASNLSAHTGASTGVHGVTGAVVGTTDTQVLSGKTLTAPVIATIVSGAGTSTLPTATGTLLSTAAAVTIGQGGTGQATKAPAFNALAPTSTKGDIIVHDGTNNVREPIGTDGTTPVADSLQTSGLKWTTITGVKNYITNSSAESSTSGWATYADSGTRPVDGTGGTATQITWTRNTVSPLRGVASFLLSKSAANALGQGVSYDFTIDAADKAKVLQISMDYSVSVASTYVGGSSTTDSDIIVYIYDVTNSVLIEPAPFKCDASNTGLANKYAGSFQTASNSTSYRLILHCTSALSNAFNFSADNVVVGPSAITMGTPVTDWLSFTPTGTWTSNATYTGQYRRVGSNMEVVCRVVSNGSSPTGAGTNFKFNMPSGYTIDTAKLAEQGTINSGVDALGVGSVLDNGTAYYSAVPTLHDSTSIIMEIVNSSATNATFTSSVNYTANQPITYANGDAVMAHFTVPIVGWSSNVQMSDAADTRVVTTRYTSTSTASATAGGTLRINFDTKDYDTHGSVTTGASWSYTAPIPGYYKIGVGVGFGAGNVTAQSTDIFLFKNGVSGQRILRMLAGATSGPTNGVGNGNIQLNAGDTIYLQAQNNGGATISLNGTAVDNWVTIERISGPSQVASSETVSCRYTQTSAQSIPSGTITTVIMNVKDRDTHSAYDTTLGRFVAPSAGIYSVKAYNSFPASSMTVGLTCQSYVYKNGSIVIPGQPLTSHNTTSTVYSPTINTEVRMNAGDYLELRIQQNIASPKTLDGSTFTNELCITRIGN